MNRRGRDQSTINGKIDILEKIIKGVRGKKRKKGKEKTQIKRGKGWEEGESKKNIRKETKEKIRDEVQGK